MTVKRRFRLYHPQVYLFILLGLLLTLYLYHYTPALYDYALWLEDGAFVREDGTIWKTNSQIDETRLLVKYTRSAAFKFSGLSSFTPPANLPMHEMACHLTDAFIGSDGSVWRCSDAEGGDIAELTLFAAPAPDFEDFSDIQLQRFQGYNFNGDEQYTVFAAIQFEASREDLQELEAKLAVRFEDGWYYISSAHAPLTAGSPFSNSTQCSAQFNFPDCYFKPAFYGIYFRMDIFDHTSGERLASKQLYAESTSHDITVPSQYTFS